MKKYYFTFGQIHRHVINKVVYDRNCVVLIEAKNSNAAREKMFKTFGPKWSFQYNNLPDMSFFPRGVIKL